MSCFALLDDCAATAGHPTSRLYTGLVGECRCEDPRCLEAVWTQVEREMRAGRHIERIGNPSNPEAPGRG
jgi:para-aminobenzoate synthetase/4-amino-4-deoxychorismate lyase